MLLPTNTKSLFVIIINMLQLSHFRLYFISPSYRYKRYHCYSCCFHQSHYRYFHYRLLIIFSERSEVMCHAFYTLMCEAKCLKLVANVAYKCNASTQGRSVSQNTVMERNQCRHFFLFRLKKICRSWIFAKIFFSASHYSL